MSSQALMSGKVVLVTGGSRGLGKAMAAMLAAAGASVIATSRNSPSARLAIKPGKITEAYLDISVPTSIHDLFRRIEDENCRLDVAVNNAGVGIFKPFTEITLPEWNDVIQTNLTGTFLCAQEEFRRMKRQGGGRIINIGSVSDHLALPENGAYAASKFGVRALSLVLNEEGIAHNVRVSLVSPGAVYTEIWHGRAGFDPKDMLQPEDVARTVLDIAHRPLHVRIDEVKLMPPKGAL